MLEVFKLLVGIGVLILGVIIGKVMARLTKEEIKGGQPYFKLLTIIGLIGGIVGLIIQNDTLLFTMFFISIVTAQSVKKKKSKSGSTKSKSVSTQSSKLKKKSKK